MATLSTEERILALRKQANAALGYPFGVATTAPPTPAPAPVSPIIPVRTVAPRPAAAAAPAPVPAPAPFDPSQDIARSQAVAEAMKAAGTFPTAPAPAVPGLPVSGPTTPPPATPGTPPEVPKEDFLTKFLRMREQITGPQVDVEAEKSKIFEQAERQKAEDRRYIQSQFDALRRQAEAEGQRRVQSARVGIGMAEGLNYASTGDEEITNKVTQTITDLSNITGQEAEALSKLNTQYSEQSRKEFETLTNARRAKEKESIDLFNQLAENELKAQQEDRLRRGETRTQANQERDDARAVLNKILDSFAGADLAALPKEIRDALLQIEKEAGYPPGFAEQGLQTLKELRQQQQDLVNQGKLDQGQAKLEQQLLIAQMNAMIKATQGTPSGVTINIPGLGDVTGTKAPPKSGPSVAEEQELFDSKTGAQIGYRQRLRDGSIKLVDLQGKELTMTPKSATTVKPAATKFQNPFVNQ